MSFGYATTQEAAMALIRAGTEIFSIGDIEDAQIFFDASHELLFVSSPPKNDHRIMELARQKLEISRTRLPKKTTTVPPTCRCHRGPDDWSVATASSSTRETTTTTRTTKETSKSCCHDHLPSPDLYEPGECDVGPRLLNLPVCPTYGPNDSLNLLQATVMFNKGLVCHSKGQIELAEGFYRTVADTTTALLTSQMALFGNSPTSSDVMITIKELAMRSHNNLGVLYYLQYRAQSEQALQVAVQFAKQLSSYNVRYNLEYASVLSNHCRIAFMRGDQHSIVHHVQEIVRLRRTVLPMDHVDVAAAIWNVGATLYHTGEDKNASFYLMQYLGIASQRPIIDEVVDAVPALVFLLTIQNRQSTDSLSQELLTGLNNLQQYRREEGRDSPAMASILNYIGTILFHQHEYHHALVFFLEELRLEDKKDLDNRSSSHQRSDSPSVISVTCNNVGRIMQELGRYKEAVYFYQRSLQEWYGTEDENENMRGQRMEQKIRFSQNKIGQCKNQSAVVNLYSTVWYNLGLISDKVGSFDDAMYAFQMALSLRKLLVGSNHADVACLLYNIGVLQMEKNLLDEAFESLVEALRIRSACDAGQLSDEHLVRTLQKLAALLKKEGHLPKALATYREIIDIHNSSTGLYLEAGQAWNGTAEMHHALNAMSDAIEAATHGVECLRCVYNHSKPDETLSSTLIESLLLQASLYHELAEPVLAGSIIQEALALARPLRDAKVSASLTALLDVTSLLSQWHCAPVA